MTWKSVKNAKGYYVYRSVNGGTYKKVATVDATNWLNVSVKNGNFYSYKIYEYSGSTVSKASAIKSSYYLTVPKNPKLSNLKTRKLEATWKKNSSASGYQIQISLKKNFSSSTRVANVMKKKLTVSKLKKKKKYYVRIRSYKKYGSTTYYSAWSSTKSVKIKK